MPVTVKLDEGQFNSLIESLTGEAVEVPAEVETPEVPDVSGETVEYPSKVDTPDVPDVPGKEITYTSTVDTPDLPDIQGGIAYYTPQVEGSADGETAEGTINYDKGTVESADGETSEGIINYDKGDVEKADGTVSTGTINYDLGTVAVPTGMVASGTINYALGTVATPGKTMGTFGQARAYAKGSLTDFPAYGDGRVSLPNDQKALVNEEYINGHSESIVRDGVWSLIPGGAHMENLKKGDIIFSAQQTEDLLKRGATPGHARAYAQGRDALMEQMKNQIEMDKKTEIEVDGYKDFVFSNRQNKPFITQTIGRILNRIVDDYNSDIKKFGGTIEPLPHIHPHLLRHTSCSRMAEAGVDPRTLQDIMGHASMKITMELYNHVTDERLTKEIQKLNNRRIS